MKKTILRISALTFIISILSCISAFASTSDIFDTTFYDGYGKRYGSGLLAPNVVDSSDNVDVSRGDVIASETDYTIIGRNGFSVPVTRVYNTDISIGLYEEQEYSSKKEVVTYIGYYYYSGATGNRILVAFKNEFEAYENKVEFIGVDERKKTKQSDNGFQYYKFSSLTTGTSSQCYFTRDTSSGPVYITTDSYYREKRYEITDKSHQIILGGGWVIRKPGYSYYDSMGGDDDDAYTYFTFQDMYGEAFNVELHYNELSNGSHSFLDYDIIDSDVYYTISFANEDDISNNVAHTKGFDYNMVIESEEGIKYYFECIDYKKHILCAIGDRYDNVIMVDMETETSQVMTYIDENNIVYTVSADGISKNVDGSVTDIVSYWFGYCTSEEDYNDEYSCDDTAELSVRKIEGSDDIAYSSDVTTYRMTQYLNYEWVVGYLSHLDRGEHMKGCYITEIEYPTCMKKKYEYDKFETGLIDSYNPILSYEDYWDVLYNKKTYDYDYTSSSTYGYYISECISYDYADWDSSHISKTAYEFNNKGKTTKKTLYQGNSEYSWNEYTWKNNGYKAPLSVDTMDTGTFKPEISTYYTYNTQKLPTRVEYGNVTTDYEYGKYNNVTLSQSDKDVNVRIKKVNTLTSDEKSVADTKVYENDVLKSRTSYTYDSSGDILSMTKYVSDNKTIVTNYTHDYSAEGNKTTVARLSDIKDADETALSDIVITTVTDVNGNVISEMDGNGNITTYEYDQQNRITRIKYPKFTNLNYSYDVARNIVYFTNARGDETIYQYDPWGNLESVYYYLSDGITKIILEEYIYDFRHNLIEFRRYREGDTVYDKSVYTYDFLNRVLTESVYDISGEEVKKTTYTYEKSSDNDYPATVTSMTVSGNGETFATTEVKTNYLGHTLYQKQTDSDDNERTYTYTTDYMGNVLSVTAPDNTVESYTYDHLGNALTYTNQMGDTAITSYNMAGQPITTTDFKGNTTTYTYDEVGRQIMVTLPFSDTANSKVKTYYDSNANVIKKAVQSNAEDESEYYTITDYAYDSLNRLSYVTQHPEPTSNEYTQYSYDKNGNVKIVVKGADTVLTNVNVNSIPDNAKYLNYTYDRLDRCTKMTGTLSTVQRQYTYDTAGNMLTETKGGNTVNYTYDPFGNVLTIKGGTDTSKHISYTYNALGSRTSMTDETGTTNYTYNDFGELTTESKGDIIKTSSYDALGNRTSFAVANDGTGILNNTYTYDSLGRMLSVSGNGETTNYTYDENGNLITKTTGDMTTSYTYNKANLCLTENGNALDGDADSEYTYYLDGNMYLYYDNPTGKQRGYMYDGMSRLVLMAESDGDDNYHTYDYYTYDKFGNRILKEHEINNAITENISYTYANGVLASSVKSERIDNVLTPIYTTQYTYDSNGNQTGKSVYASDNTLESQTSYAYDFLNRLDSVTVNDTITSYAYDGDNLRQTKTTNGISTQYILDGANVVAEISGLTTNSYIRGNSIEFGFENGTNAEYYRTNSLGDIRNIITPDDELLNGTNKSYDEFGNILTNSDNDISFGYRGEYHDGETDLIYLRNRYYDSETGRFITEDPVMDGGNWYIYCGNNPIMFIDPFGLTTLKEALLYIKANPEAAKKLQCDNIDEYLSKLYEETDKWIAKISTKNPNTVKEFDDMIIIISYIRIYGNASEEMLDGATYKNLFLKGVRDGWSGEFEDKSVYVLFPEKSFRKTQQYLNVNISVKFATPHHVYYGQYYNKGSINMYTGYIDMNNNKIKYEYDGFKATSAHEFGHSLGLGDVYNDTDITIKFPSIMNYEWEVNGRAQPIDYAMLLANLKNPNMVKYSSRKDLIAKYVNP